MLRYFIAATIFFSLELFAFEEIQDKRKLKILSSSLERQQSAKIRLDNGLEAFIVSDPDTSKAGAVLTVLAGSWSDPIEHPGMAHFLEHMLFMGTEEYPDESEYQRYIHDHGGEANAFTTDTATSYMFSIDPDYLPDALARFSSFFKKPLLNTSQVERELKAIDQEYGKNIENDDIREIFVHKSLLNPHHPAIKFSMGNSSTLKNVTRNELRDFYESHYSANLMRLYVIGKEPIDQLKASVETAFKSVPNKNIEKYSPLEPLSNPDYQGKLVVIEPIKDIRTLSLVFEVPSHLIDKELKPHQLLSHILGHEGEGSLLSVLKEKNLAEGISAGDLTTSDNNLEFTIEISLTEKGVEEWQEVLLLTFQALKRLSEEKIPDFIFKDTQAIQKIEYQFQTRKDVFSDLMKKGMQLSQESIDTFPEQTLILDQFDPKITQSVAKNLSIDKAYIYLMAKNLPFKLEQKEKWVGATFGIYPLPKSLIEKISSLPLSQEIKLPAQNPFLPSDFTMRPKEEEFSKRAIIPIPTALIDNSKAHIFFAQEHEFQEPKCGLSFLVRNSSITPQDAKSIVLAELYLKALNDQLNPFVYPAQVAGLNFSIKRDDLGLMINVQGYSDTSDTLFAYITDVISSKKLPFQRFSQYKTRLMTDYQNAVFFNPVQMSLLLLKASLFKYFPMPDEKAKILAALTEDDLRAFTETLFSEGFVEGVIVGNLSSQEALEIAHRAETVFAKNPLKEPYYEREILDLKNALGPLYLQQNIASQGNAALLLIEFPPPYTLKMRAIHQILTQAIQEPFYSDLRTRQQTGYIVQASGEEIDRRLMTFFITQSNTHSPRDLLARFELFLENFIQELTREELTEERFNAIKAALLFDLKHPVKNLAQTVDLLANLLFLYNGDFHWVEKRIAAMESLTYEECLQGIQAALAKSNGRRFAILLTGKTNGVPFFDYKPVNSLESFKKEEDYKHESS